MSWIRREESLLDKCRNLIEEEILDEIFYQCKVQEKGLSSSFVEGLCLKEWKNCEFIFDPSRSHFKGKWNEIIGLEEIKRELIRLVQHPFLLKDKDIEPVRAILLFGPDGCEKRPLVQALAHESKAKLEILSPRQFDQLSSLIDESTESTILFLDEADLIAPPVEFKQVAVATYRMQDPLMSLMTAIAKIKSTTNPVVLILATDNPELISSILLKQEYVSESIYVPPPDLEERKAIFEKLMAEKPLASDVDFQKLAEKTKNFSVYDIRKLIKNVELSWAEKSFEEEKKEITMDDFIDEMDEVVPSITRSILSRFEQSARKYAAIEKEIKKEVKLDWDVIGGYESVKEQLKNIVAILTSEETIQQYGLKPPRGILLFGPPGCGKTYMTKVMSSVADANFQYVLASDLLSKWLGESEQRISDIFTTAKINPPTILFFDELDGLAFERARTTDHPYLVTILSTFLAEVSELTPDDYVLVVGATNRPEDIDPAFLRPGRFDERIAIGPPDEQARREIFKIHSKDLPLAEDVDFDILAKKTKNYTGAEIEYICHSTQRTVARGAMRTGFRKITMKDFLNQIAMTKPDLSDEDIKAFREMAERFERRGHPVPKREWEEITWDDIGGLHEAKKFLKEHITIPLKHVEEIKEYGMKPRQGIILYGLPGVGKSLLIKAAVRDSGANFFTFSALDLTSILAYRTDGHKRFRELLKDAERVAPSVILLENIETIPTETAVFIASELSKLKHESPVIFVCETSYLAEIPEVLKRLNQIEYIIPIPPPNFEERLEILKIKSKSFPIVEDIDFSKIAEKTKYFTGSDLNKLLRDASHLVFLRKLETKSDAKITMEDILQAIPRVEPTLTQDQIEEFERQARKIQRGKVPLRRDPSYSLFYG